MNQTECYRCYTPMIVDKVKKHCKHCNWLRCVACTMWFDPTKTPIETEE